MVSDLVIHLITYRTDVQCDRFKDGEALKDNEDYILSQDEVENTYTLVLPVAHESHAGNYTVKASNEHGYDESSVRFFVFIIVTLISIGNNCLLS